MLTWVLGSAVGLILLALIVHFASTGKAIKIATIILATIGGLAAGVVIGLLGAVMYGESIQQEIYGDLYKPGLMPAPGVMKAPSSGGAPPAVEAPKSESATTAGGGPGGTNLGADYPGGDNSKKEPAKSGAPN